MTGYPLQAAWELRRRQEEAALRALEEARRARAAAEDRAAQRRQRWENAHTAWSRAQAHVPATVHEAGDHDRFVARLRDESRRAEAVYAEFAQGPLRQAVAAEEQAQRAYVEARRLREAIDRHQENFRGEQRRAEERREEEAAEEAARATRHARTR